MSVSAHSPQAGGDGSWEPLDDHLRAVGDRAAEFAAPFGWSRIAGLAGRLHDIGKCSADFQDYIRNLRTSGGDHSGAGAIEAGKIGLPKPLAQALTAIIAGHHAGLADGADLAERLMRDVPAYPGWVAYSGPMPPLSALRPKPGFTKSGEAGFHGAFLTRMLFSCLVDADSIETARFYGEPERSPFTPLPDLRDRLDDHLDALAAAAPRTGRSPRVPSDFRPAAAVMVAPCIASA